ncbi:hypothetical protein B0H63DRAFT_519167 [Podospora didyma]|uniref:RING-type domain-containing protein n=1 Tax=Podospora didyma TaxID=330526 RepID=A0AAE0NYD0_9PEZI|nr:hypothetical protein B0H63DRAFT_519167 [Podospora didyma]
MSSPFEIPRGLFTGHPPPTFGRDDHCQESLWHVVKKYMKSPGSFEGKVPYMMCPACQVRELSIKSVPVCHDLFEDVEVTHGWVLWCGHMMCAECFSQLCADADEQQNAKVVCPVCRRELGFIASRCQCVILPVVFLPYLGCKNTCVDNVPLTIPEIALGRPIIPPGCSDCRKEYMLEQAHDLARSIADVPQRLVAQAISEEASRLYDARGYAPDDPRRVDFRPMNDAINFDAILRRQQEAVMEDPQDGERCRWRRGT